MFLIDETNGLDWTPELLESAIYGYGCPGYTREEAEKEFGSAEYKVTSVLDNPNRDKIVESIDISSNYKWMGESMELSIQERLKDLRVERGLTLEQLAEKSDLLNNPNPQRGRK